MSHPANDQYEESVREAQQEKNQHEKVEVKKKKLFEQEKEVMLKYK